MILDQNMRGGVPVGQLHAITPWEALLVRHLRLWCDGPEGRLKVKNDWERAGPKAAAENTLAVFDALIITLTSYARRPLVRHCLTCECLGADEGVFVQIVSAASGGALDDAALMSGLIAMPAHAEHIAILAAQVGAAFRARGFARADQHPTRPSAQHRVLH
ncbi:hypothetical protein ACFQDZ_19120 [Sulfitobacter pacificus]|uniref:hypothetical protein n=2 Tax=Sulfitobacter pacificus TaxID=1499314 RepID=UPI00361FA81C